MTNHLEVMKYEAEKVLTFAARRKDSLDSFQQLVYARYVGKYQGIDILAEKLLPVDEYVLFNRYIVELKLKLGLDFD